MPFRASAHSIDSAQHTSIRVHAVFSIATIVRMDDDRRQPVAGDAFGAILRRCWDAGVATGSAFEIVERDDGYIGVGDAARYFAGAESWSPVERWACQRVAGRVLDVGCGAGRHALPLTQSGHDVVGLDASPGGLCRHATRCERGRGIRGADPT